MTTTTATDPRLLKLAGLIEQQRLEALRRQYNYPDKVCYLENDAKVTIKPGKRYIKVDIRTSGRYMVDEVGNIWGIKAYGVVHRGHHYGTLDTIDDYYWGGYVAGRKQR